MNRSAQVFTRWLGPSVIAIATLVVMDGVSQAQLPPGQTTPVGGSAICQPPQPNEFLLLVVTRTPETQNQVQQLLPPNASVATCGYLNEVVMRVGGFRTVERANAWARYINESTGLGAYVVRPAETLSATAPPSIETTATVNPPAAQVSQSTTASSSSVYRPQPLGPGYAVLVDYANQPEIAAKVQQILSKDVGLVAYRQSPFLLALYTNDATAAYGALQTLSDRGLWATLVDSRRVVLLRQAVVLTPTAAR